MRRTQSASLHPSSQVGSSSSANLETITLDDEGKKRIADGMWEYLPAIPDLAVNTHIKIWSFYDENDVSLTVIWDQVKDTNGATIPTLTDNRGGGMVITTGSVEGNVLDNWNFVKTKSAPVQFVDGKGTWLLVDVTVEQTNPNPYGFDDFCFGFAEDLTFSDNWIDTPGYDPAQPSPGYHFGDAAVYADMVNFPYEETDPYFQYEANWDDLNQSDLPSTLTSIASRGAPLEGYETYPGRALEGYRQDLSITSIDNIMDGNFHRVILGAVPSNDQSERWDIILYDNNEIVMVCENVEVETDKNMEVFVGSYSPDARLTIRRIILIQDE